MSAPFVPVYNEGVPDVERHADVRRIQPADHLAQIREIPSQETLSRMILYQTCNADRLIQVCQISKLISNLRELFLHRHVLLPIDKPQPVELGANLLCCA